MAFIKNFGTFLYNKIWGETKQPTVIVEELDKLSPPNNNTINLKDEPKSKTFILKDDPTDDDFESLRKLELAKLFDSVNKDEKTFVLDDLLKDNLDVKESEIFRLEKKLTNLNEIESEISLRFRQLSGYDYEDQEAIDKRLTIMENLGVIKIGNKLVDSYEKYSANLGVDLDDVFKGMIISLVGFTSLGSLIAIAKELHGLKMTILSGEYINKRNDRCDIKFMKINDLHIHMLMYRILFRVKTKNFKLFAKIETCKIDIKRISAHAIIFNKYFKAPHYEKVVQQVNKLCKQSRSGLQKVEYHKIRSLIRGGSSPELDVI